MIIIDEEFGEIAVRKSALARHIKFSLAPSGKLRISAPVYVSDFRIRRLVKSSRDELRKLFGRMKNDRTLKDGQVVGKSYTVVVKESVRPSVNISGKQIVVCVVDKSDNVVVNQEIRDVLIKALKSDAKDYLAKRLEVLAETYGFSYEKVRLSHASSRWGSCSSNGTISLNISLMNLPYPLVDYVLVHELSHTKHMNHSTEFWNEVNRCDPNYKRHKMLLKKFSPNI